MTDPIALPLVVGGTGFLGLNIAQALRDRGLPVRITRRESSITFTPRRLGLEMVQASLDDEESLVAAMEGRDVVFFTAGHYPRWSVDGEAQVARAVAGVRTALRAARRARVRRFVFTSSITTIGPAPPGRPATEDDEWPAPPPSVYFAVKLALEREVRQAARDGFPAVIVCPTGCLGRYDIKAGTGFFVVALATGRLPFVVDGPLDVVGVEDAAAAHLAAAERGRVGARYIVAAHPVGAADLIARAASRLGLRPPTETLDLETALERCRVQEERCARAGRGRPDVPVEFLDMLRFGGHYDNTRARTDLGFEPESLDVVLDKACAWFRRAGYLGRQAGPPTQETSP